MDAETATLTLAERRKDRAVPLAHAPGVAGRGPWGDEISDILSDMLRVVRLRGAIFSHVECTDPWVAETPGSIEIIPAIMPGVERKTELGPG